MLAAREYIYIVMCVSQAQTCDDSHDISEVEVDKVGGDPLFCQLTDARVFSVQTIARRYTLCLTAASWTNSTSLTIVTPHIRY
jgi:hypothetical protein